jgi:hypothetical protein
VWERKILSFSRNKAVVRKVPLLFSPPYERRGEWKSLSLPKSRIEILSYFQGQVEWKKSHHIFPLLS